jgi:hypothetical protein
MNQPAFPTGIITDGKGNIIGGSNGMTLRDYFAAKAMQALLTRETRISEDAMLYAGAAYDVADAMMKAREA